MFRCVPLLCCAIGLLFQSVASAQLFFLHLGPEVKNKRIVEATLDAADQMNDPTRMADFLHTRLWANCGSANDPQKIELVPNHGKLEGQIILDSPGIQTGVAVMGECIYGVQVNQYKRYYPKTVAGDPEQLNQLKPDKTLGLEIIPRFNEDGTIEFTAYRYAVPMADADLVITDKEGHIRGTPDRTDIKTDVKGKATWIPPGDGVYKVYLRHVDQQSGRFNNAQYNTIADESVLTFTLPIVETGTQALIHRVRVATIQNLLGPLVLFFFAGFIAKLIKSTLEFPEQAYKVMVIYLLLSIGYEGGHQLKAEPNPIAALMPLSIGFFVNALVAILAILVLLKVLGFDVPNSAALGALYGSDSAGMYAVALALVKSFHLTYAGYMPAMLAVMEIPGVLVGIVFYQYLTRHQQPEGNATTQPGHHRSSILGVLIHELKSPGVYLLLAGMVVGYLTVNSEYVKTEAFFIVPFKGIMCLFLFENGMKAGEQVSALKQGALKLILFGTLFPLTMGVIAVFIAKAIGLSAGSAMLFAVLVAAPSNIAAPAAMRLAIPEANPSIYFTTGLGISFPTLVVFGVPLFYVLTQVIY